MALFFMYFTYLSLAKNYIYRKMGLSTLPFNSFVVLFKGSSSYIISYYFWTQVDVKDFCLKTKWFWYFCWVNDCTWWGFSGSVCASLTFQLVLPRGGIHGYRLLCECADWGSYSGIFSLCKLDLNVCCGHQASHQQSCGSCFTPSPLLVSVSYNTE